MIWSITSYDCTLVSSDIKLLVIGLSRNYSQTLVPVVVVTDYMMILLPLDLADDLQIQATEIDRSEIFLTQVQMGVGGKERTVGMEEI